jgi:molybdopterin converting factor small subunit
MYTEGELQGKTVRELRELCRSYEITGYSRMIKDDIVDAILEAQEYGGNNEDNRSEDVIEQIEGKFFSKLDVEDTGHYTTTIQVSCGANTNRFAVVGKTIGEVADTLREVLNIGDFASPLVNGHNEDYKYILKDGDVLEFLKPAGEKGLL